MKKINIGNDLNAISQFLDEACSDIKDLQKKIKILKDIRKKRCNKDILEKQILKWDEIIEFYEFFVEDVDVNAERVKKISKEFKKLGKKFKVDKDIQEHMKSHERWTFNW